jgi:transposase
MLSVTPQMRVLVAVEPEDFRRGIDGLAQRCRAVLCEDPMSGTVFVFRNRRATAVKVLVYDGQGFWLCYKRLSAGRYRWWPGHGGQKVSALAAHELMVLLRGGDARAIGASPDWRPVGQPARRPARL